MKKEKKYLNKKEAEHLHDLLNYYGHDQVVNAAYNMFVRDETPLPKHWKSDKEFLHSFYLFYNLAENLNRSKFVDVIINVKLPKQIKANKEEEKIVSNKLLFEKESINIHDFLEHMSDFFEYETILMSLGYPPDYRNGGKKGGKKEKKII